MNFNIKHISLSIAFFILVNLVSFGQIISVKSSKDSILIGEPIDLSIQYDLKNVTSNLSFSEGDSIGNGFEVLEVISSDTIEESIFNQNIVVTCFELGNQFIPSFSIFVDSNKHVSKPIPVFVSLMKVDTTQPIKDIKPIIYDNLTFNDKANLLWKWIKNYWYIWIPILLGLFFLIWFLFFKKKTVKEEKLPIKEIIPAHVMAVSKLKELDEKQLWQKGKQKEYNVALTEIIQQYITNRYNVSTSERTSSEILQSLRFIEMGEENKMNLRELLMLSDLVKFAKELPTPDENLKVMKNAYLFVATTKKQVS